MLKKLDFITPTMLKVLYMFHEHPMQEVHEREVVRRTGISEGSANNMLRKLSEVGILERNVKGRMVFYSLNLKNALSRQLKILFNVYSLNELVNKLKQYSKKIILFGSCSEGTDTDESDIDLFILTNDRGKITSEINAYQEIERQISPVIVNSTEFVELRKNDKPLYDRILKGLSLWETE